MERIEPANKFQNSPGPLKKERIYIRLDSESKKLVGRAAAYADEAISSFVRRAALETARGIVRDQEILTLSEQDSKGFLDALDNPPAPNKGLLKAASRYRQLTGL